MCATTAITNYRGVGQAVVANSIFLHYTLVDHAVPIVWIYVCVSKEKTQNSAYKE